MFEITTLPANIEKDVVFVLTDSMRNYSRKSKKFISVSDIKIIMKKLEPTTYFRNPNFLKTSLLESYIDSKKVIRVCIQNAISSSPV